MNLKKFNQKNQGRRTMTENNKQTWISKVSYLNHQADIKETWNMINAIQGNPKYNQIT